MYYFIAQEQPKITTCLWAPTVSSMASSLPFFLMVLHGSICLYSASVCRPPWPGPGLLPTADNGAPASAYPGDLSSKWKEVWLLQVCPLTATCTLWHLPSPIIKIKIIKCDREYGTGEITQWLRTSICYSCRRLIFSPHYPLGDSQTPITLVPGDPLFTSQASGMQGCTHIHAGNHSYI